jgi:hypothetical protein
MRFRKGKNREQRNYLFFGAQGQKRSDHYGWKGIYVQLYKYTVCDVSCGKGTSNSARESKDSPKIRTHVQTSSMERLGLFCLNPYLIISRTKPSDNSERNIRSGTYSNRAMRIHVASGTQMCTSERSRKTRHRFLVYVMGYSIAYSIKRILRSLVRSRTETLSSLRESVWLEPKTSSTLTFIFNLKLDNSCCLLLLPLALVDV